MDWDIRAAFSGQRTFGDVFAGVEKRDLEALTEELYAQLQAIVAGVPEAGVTFVPQDPALADPIEAGWTLGHVVVHATATTEESAARAAMLARGVPTDVRLRYEVPWETVQTLAQVTARIEESLRMCRGFLQAWPDMPHLDVAISPFPNGGPLNAVALYALGLFHLNSHLAQIREIVRQAQAARPPGQAAGGP